MISIPIELVSKLLIQLTSIENENLRWTICSTQRDRKISPLISPLYACLVQLEKGSYITYYIYLVDMLHIESINYVYIEDSFTSKCVGGIPRLQPHCFDLNNINYFTSCNEESSINIVALIRYKGESFRNSTHYKWLCEFIASREFLIELSSIQRRSSSITNSKVPSGMLNTSIREVKEYIEELMKHRDIKRSSND